MKMCNLDLGFIVLGGGVAFALYFAYHYRVGNGDLDYNVGISYHYQGNVIDENS